jgi:hypothetical protein
MLKIKKNKKIILIYSVRVIYEFKMALHEKKF